MNAATECESAAAATPIRRRSMMIVTSEAYNKLSERTKAELLSAVFGSEGPGQRPLGEEFGFSAKQWEDVARLSPGQVERLIDEATSLYEGTRMALQLFAEHGPILHSTFIKNHCLDPNGNKYWPDGLDKFQGGTTRRVRSPDVTGDKHAMLLTWPEWKNGEGYYGISPETHRSLRIYFNLD